MVDLMEAPDRSSCYEKDGIESSLGSFVGPRSGSVSTNAVPERFDSGTMLVDWWKVCLVTER